MLTFEELPLELFGIDLGLTLILVSDGRLILEVNPMFVPTYDYSKDGITACFDYEGFALMEPGQDFQAYDYGVAYPYKEMPALKQWLVEQKLRLT